mmetsp:Transcript_31382/g.46365  ORF Transcript_31382/g.46365 Transcript_31382/m.46365 type:complete len:133 (+) Transcript_31382:251-649(+)
MLNNNDKQCSVLYPASQKAKNTLQDGLEARGFTVTRLNTYDTIPATWNAHQTEMAKGANVVCFASPSAVKSWVKNQEKANGRCERVAAACIGETSAQACREQEWKESQIYYPEKPGVEGWVNAVVEALDSIH